MNKRIQELAINCAGQLEWDFPKDPESFTFSRHELEKFAELIVRECAGVTLDYKNDDHYEGWCDHCAEILTHFGVEE